MRLNNIKFKRWKKSWQNGESNLGLRIDELTFYHLRRWRTLTWSHSNRLHILQYNNTYKSKLFLSNFKNKLNIVFLNWSPQKRAQRVEKLSGTLKFVLQDMIHEDSIS